MICVPLNEKKEPDYAVIVPETGRTYRQDDGRYFGLVCDVFPKVAEQITTALATHPKSASPNSNNSSEDDAGYEYIWVSSHNLSFPLPFRRFKLVLTVRTDKQTRPRTDERRLGARRGTRPFVRDPWPARRWKVLNCLH